MRGGRLGILLVLCAAVLAAGCLGGDGAPAAEDGADADDVETASQQEATEPADAPTDDASQGTDVLGPEDEVEGPDWQVGQHFGYHLFSHTNDTEGQHYDLAVVEDTGDGWVLAPSNRTLSKFQAISDFRFLGTFDKADLTTTEDGEPFRWYDWPLFDGKTWTEQEEWLGESYEITYTVTYEPGIEVGDEEHQGFAIEGRTSDGKLFREYDYVSEVGWFAHYFEYDPEEGADDEWRVHVMTMGHGDAYTGTAYTDEATVHLSHFNGVSPFFLEPKPYDAFTVSESATHVAGFAWSAAFTGAHETVLVDPEQETYRWSALAPPLFFDGEFEALVEEAIPGEWHLATAGAGVFAGGGGLFAETVETQYELERGEVVNVSP